MTIPPRGTMARSNAEALVEFRRLGRALRPALPSLIVTSFIFWLGLLIGGIAGWLHL